MKSLGGYSIVEAIGHHANKLYGIALLHIEREVVGLNLVECHQFVDKMFHLRTVADGHIQRFAHFFIYLAGTDAFEWRHDK